MSNRLRPAARRQTIARLRNMVSALRLQVSRWNTATQVFDASLPESWKFRKATPEELPENQVAEWQLLDWHMAEIQRQAQQIRDRCTQAIQILQEP